MPGCAVVGYLGGMKKIAAVTLTAVALAAALAGCSAVEQATDDATDAVKDAGASATDEVKSQATDAVKGEITKAVESGVKINPNEITEAQIATGLSLAGVENASELAKEIKAQGPYTAENLGSKVTETLSANGISQEQIDQLLTILEVPEEGTAGE